MRSSAHPCRRRTRGVLPHREASPKGRLWAHSRIALCPPALSVSTGDGSNVRPRASPNIFRGENEVRTRIRRLPSASGRTSYSPPRARHSRPAWPHRRHCAAEAANAFISRAACRSRHPRGLHVRHCSSGGPALAFALKAGTGAPDMPTHAPPAPAPTSSPSPHLHRSLPRRPHLPSCPAPLLLRAPTPGPPSPHVRPLTHSSI
jgi:hypothetical protein